jgi:hypothetical protein
MRHPPVQARQADQAPRHSLRGPQWQLVEHLEGEHALDCRVTEHPRPAPPPGALLCMPGQVRREPDGQITAGDQTPVVLPPFPVPIPLPPPLSPCRSPAQDQLPASFAQQRPVRRASGRRLPSTIAGL